MDLALVRGPKFSEFPGPQLDHVKHLLALILRFFVPLSGFDDCILLLLRITAFKDKMYKNNHVCAGKGSQLRETPRKQSCPHLSAPVRQMSAN